MEKIFTVSFLAACFFMSFGISVDICCATLSRFRKFSKLKAAFTWGWRCGLTHTVGPMIGIFAFYFLSRFMPFLEVVMGVIAAYLIYYLLSFEFKELAGLAAEGDEEFPYGFRWMKRRLNPEWLLVAAVSMDAPLSGPGKAAAAVSWNLMQLVVSFPLVGLMVGGIALAASFGAYVLDRKLTMATARSIQGMAYFQVIGLWTETVVIGFFGWLALCYYTLRQDLPWYVVAGVSLIATTIPFLFFRKRIWETQVEEAKKIVEGKE